MERVNAMANRYAHYLKGEGVQRGDTVGVVMENRIELQGLIIGLFKLGFSGAVNITCQAVL